MDSIVGQIDQICERIEPSWGALSRNGKENLRITVRAALATHRELSLVEDTIDTVVKEKVTTASMVFPIRLLPALRSAIREHGKHKRWRALSRAGRIAPGHANLDALRADAMDEVLSIVDGALASSTIEN